MAGVMSKCPFWSTGKEKIECYKECPIFTSELCGGQDSAKCIFHQCSEVSNMNLGDIIKEDYSFLDLSIYDEDRNMNIAY